jgi:flavin reductase (DIM6/NTAB) family NADH-FMN oxidoreductase RutF
MRRRSAGGGVTAVDNRVRRKALRLLSNGVYVLTSRAEERCGAATVSWVSQVSFKPPLIMAAVRQGSNVYKCLEQSRVAALHIVGNGQQEIARRFFFPTAGGGDTINGEPVVAGKTTAPLLANLPAHLECEVDRIVNTDGDHAVVILRVVEAGCPDEVLPLTMAQTPWEYGG